MDFPAGRCPKHDVPLLVRRNVQDSTFDFSCLLCDAEAHGCTEQEIAALKRGFAKWQKEKG